MSDNTTDFCLARKRFRCVRRTIGFDVRRQGLDFAVVDCRGFEVAQCECLEYAAAIAEALNEVK